MIIPTFEKFREYSKQGNIIPVYKAVTADLLTPVLAYLKVQAENPHAFLLESIEGGEKIARYSFLGCNPYLTLSSRGDTVEIVRSGERMQRKGQLLDVMRKITERYRPVTVPGLPPFVGGAVGYVSYDAVRWVETIPQTGEDDLKLDDAMMMFFSTILAFDHARQQILIISNAFIEESAPQLEAKYEKAVLKSRPWKPCSTNPWPSRRLGRRRTAASAFNRISQKRTILRPWTKPRNTSRPVTFFRLSFPSGSRRKSPATRLMFTAPCAL
jgi:anthranilate synthase component 1